MNAPVTRGPSIWGVLFLGMLMATVLLGITMLLNSQLEFFAPRILITTFLLSLSANLLSFVVFRVWRFKDARKARQEKGA